METYTTSRVTPRAVTACGTPELAGHPSERKPAGELPGAVRLKRINQSSLRVRPSSASSDMVDPTGVALATTVDRATIRFFAVVASIALTVGSVLTSAAEEPGGSTAGPVTTKAAGPDDVSPEATDVSSMITTGCGYDAWTATAFRSVVDMDVPGALSSHGLKVVRTYSSGKGGGWFFAPGWRIESVPLTRHSRTVHFPDGRTVQFDGSRSAGLGDTGALRAGPGTAERLFETTDWDNGAGESEGTTYVYLKDGSIVAFYRLSDTCGASQDADRGITCGITAFTLLSVTDPHGLVTTFSYAQLSGGTNNHWYLSQVTDEASGQFLTYTRNSTTAVLSTITASTGQSVTYTYRDDPYSPVPSTLISHVDYSDGTGADYTYADTLQQGLVNGALTTFHRMKLKTAQDSHATGPMPSIVYDYPPVGEHKFQGEITAERHFEGFSNGSAVEGTLVSGYDRSTHTETRGDGPKRTFTFESYDSDPVLHRIKEMPDFREATEPESAQHNIVYEFDHGYVDRVTDRRAAVTDYNLASDMELILGRPKTVTHPATTPSFPRSTTKYSYGPESAYPYFVYSVTDENTHTTTYSRYARVNPTDPNTGTPKPRWKQRVFKIDYPTVAGDLCYETFEYDDNGQVIHHRRRNGNYEHFAYYPNGLLWKQWNPTATATASDSEPKIVYTYYPDGHAWENRVDTVTDQRGKRTKYEYDRLSNGTAASGRGLVTKISYLDDTHAGETPSAPGGTNVQFGYDPYGRGNKIWEQNELGKITRFDYDDYNRLTNTWLPATADVPNQGAAVNDYNITGASPYNHTTKSVRKATSPLNVVTGQTFDPNFRVVTKTQGEGSGLALLSYFAYDANGNMLSSRDPRATSKDDANYATTFEYDSRNRKTRSTAPPPFAYKTEWTYDAVGNLLTTARDVGGPNATTESKSYTARNQVETVQVSPDNDFTQPRVTTFHYLPSGTLQDVTDAENQKTSFDYWPSDLKKTMTYANLDTQIWTYDDALNLINRKTTGGNYQVFTYDERNRKKSIGWYTNAAGTGTPVSWATGPHTCAYSYDFAGHLTHADNETSKVTRGYDDAGRLEFDRQTFADFPNDPKEVQYRHDADGRVAQLVVPPQANGSYDFTFWFDGASRLWRISLAPYTTSQYEYAYDKANNPVTRTNFLNNTTLSIPRDSLNRITRRDISGPGGNIAQESYGYDELSRMHTVSDEMPGGKLNQFDYDDIGQLDIVQYGLSWNGTAWASPSRTVNYGWDKAGNRDNVNENGTVTGYTNNNINQYSAVGAQTVNNAGGHQISKYANVAYAYIGDTFVAQITTLNGSTVTNSYHLQYDALGRAVQRELNGTSTYFLFEGDHWVMQYRKSTTDVTKLAEYGNALYGLGIDEVIVRNNNGQGQFFYQDWLGSTSMVLGFAAEKLESYTYDAFGKPTIRNPAGTDITATGSGINNTIMFTSREYDSLFGIYEYRNRAYHPGLGRFTTEDPKGFDAGDYNLFRYVANDPVGRVDPTGEIAQITVEGNNVWIRIPIEFSGEGATSKVIGSYVAGIEKAWSGQIGRYQVKTVVDTEAGMGKHNEMNRVQIVKNQDFRSTVVNFKNATWNNSGDKNMAAHEGGHLLGHPDRYTDVKQNDGSVRSVPNPGYEKNIMGNMSAPPSGQDITDAIKNKKVNDVIIVPQKTSQ